MTLMNEYETTMVLRPDINGEIVEAMLDKVRGTLNTTGKLLAINHWGKKRLAYEIEKQSRGIYVHAHYLGGGEAVAEIERNLRLSESVLRFLTVKIEDSVDPASKEAREYVAPAYDAVMAEQEEKPEEPEYSYDSYDRDADDDDEPRGGGPVGDDDN
jgi:small subunit ribosomal protein S6